MSVVVAQIKPCNFYCVGIKYG